MVGPSNMLYILIGMFWNVGTFGNVWPVLSVWLDEKNPSGFYSLRLGGAAKNSFAFLPASKTPVYKWDFLLHFQCFSFGSCPYIIDMMDITCMMDTTCMEDITCMVDITYI